MKIVVCIRQGRDGEINPFDACAYEEALKIPGAEITLLSMGVPACKDFLLRLTRLGAENAVLLTDKAFAGADTLATAYTLSLAIRKLSPDVVFCGRQTLEGDTAQVPAMLAQMLGFSIVTNVMKIDKNDRGFLCATRDEGEQAVKNPALLTIERINSLRLPSIRSKTGNLTVLSADDIEADRNRCGLAGSPTRVIETHENEGGKRKCKLIEQDQLIWAIGQGLKKQQATVLNHTSVGCKLKKVWIVGNSPLAFAESISDDITEISLDSPEKMAEKIKNEQPEVVLWGSDSVSKRVSSQVAAILSLGLCADCTSLETDGETLFMVRPALSGSVIAKIRTLTKPAMATVRTAQNDVRNIVVCIGYGAKSYVDEIRQFADSIKADIAATRKAVDTGIMPYRTQVGLTGKTVAPPVYLAIGVSGAVHHIVGMQQSGTVIAINPDKDAPIFDYADYGIIDSSLSLKDINNQCAIFLNQNEGQ